MKSTKKPGAGKTKGKKLKLKKQTVGDLDPKAGGRNVKGGIRIRDTNLYTCGVTCSCITCYITCVCAKA